MMISKYKVEMIQAQKGLLCKQIANKANIDLRTLSVILRRGSCRPESLGKIARGLGVKPKDIMEVSANDP